MAVAAETWEQPRTNEILDFLEWEEEMAHLPQAEVYGRSLSAVRRLGAFMLRKLSRQEVIESPEAAQAKAEFYTSVFEGFGTDRELGGGLEVRDFDEHPIIDGRVVAKDRTPISAMTEAGLILARKDAKKDKRFLPQLVRSYWDHQNALIVDQMARGETDYNTRLVVSPFPEEAAAASGNAYWRSIGYVPLLKRGFVQLYHVNEAGVLISGSLSFDGSDKHRLREIFGRFGIEIPADEVTDNWLNYAITRTLSEDEAKQLATEIADAAGDSRYKKNTNTVDVTKQYGPLMERVFNESYIHVCESLARGYQTPKARELIYQFADKAHHFNDHYASALYKMRANGDSFTNQDSIVLHELLVYSTIEMMRAFHIQKKSAPESADASYLQLAGASFQNALSNYGVEGAINNRGYSACGLSIDLGKETSDKAKDNPQNAFGGVDQKGEKAEDSNIPRRIRCIECKRVSPKEKVVKKESWCCPHCKYEVDICTGKVLHESMRSRSSKGIIATLLEALKNRRAIPKTRADFARAA